MKLIFRFHLRVQRVHDFSELLLANIFNGNYRQRLVLAAGPRKKTLKMEYINRSGI